VKDDEYTAERRRLYKDIQHHTLYQNNVEIPYTDEAWAALHSIVDTISEAAERLDALFADDHLEARLLQASTVQPVPLALPSYKRRRNTEG
jgi:hypothetical protein